MMSSVVGCRLLFSFLFVVFGEHLAQHLVVRVDLGTRSPKNWVSTPPDTKKRVRYAPKTVIYPIEGPFWAQSWPFGVSSGLKTGRFGLLASRSIRGTRFHPNPCLAAKAMAINERCRCRLKAESSCSLIVQIELARA